MEIEITNQELFDSKLEDVELDTNGKGTLETVTLIHKNGFIQPITGEHGKNEYQAEYGFIIK